MIRVLALSLVSQKESIWLFLLPADDLRSSAQREAEQGFGTRGEA